MVTVHGSISNLFIGDLEERLAKEQRESNFLRLALCYTITKLGGTVKIPYNWLQDANYYGILTTTLNDDIGHSLVIQCLPEHKD